MKRSKFFEPVQNYTFPPKKQAFYPVKIREGATIHIINNSNFRIMEPQKEFTITLTRHEMLFAISAINYAVDEIFSMGCGKETEAYNHCAALTAVNKELSRCLNIIANEH